MILWRCCQYFDSGGCRDDIGTDGGAGGCTPRAGKVGPRRNPGPYFFERLRSSAEYADRILKGDNPAELPRARAYKVRTHHQSETANLLVLEEPPALLVSADEVIE